MVVSRDDVVKQQQLLGVSFVLMGWNGLSASHLCHIDVCAGTNIDACHLCARTMPVSAIPTTNLYLGCLVQITLGVEFLLYISESS